MERKIFSYRSHFPLRINVTKIVFRITRSFTTMFFALYALGENDEAVIDPFQNNLTPIVGYVLFGAFHITNITILISMLISMMTKSFQTILVRKFF